MDLNKKRIGLFIGRFQPLTIGHCSVINEALNNSDVLVLAVGSSQKSETIQNPFSASFRSLLISKVYEKEILDGKLVLALIPDRDHPKDDEAWGRYLLNEVQRQTGLLPNIIFEGSEVVRNYWFNEDVIRYTLAKSVIPITGSLLREYIINDKYDKYLEFVPKEIATREYYLKIRSILLNIYKED